MDVLRFRVAALNLRESVVSDRVDVFSVEFQS